MLRVLQDVRFLQHRLRMLLRARQRDRELGAPFQSIGGMNLAVVCFDDRFANRQTKPDSACAVTGSAAAGEFFEELCFAAERQAWTGIGYAKNYVVGSEFCGDFDI